MRCKKQNVVQYKMDNIWALRKKKMGYSQKTSYLEYKGKICSISKIRYFKLFPKK